METNPQLLAMAKLLQAEATARGEPMFAPQQLAAALAPATVNPNLAAQGARIRAMQATRPAVQDPQWLREGLPMEGRATFLPFQDSAPGSVMNQRSLALPGIVAGAVNAFTAPNRAYTGSDPGFDPQAEAANVAMNMLGGGMGASAAVSPAPRGSLGMNVWHGTPHKFAPTKKNPLGEFSASKIGTGEGAQAYGHGLYLAESPGVAKSYKDALEQEYLFRGKPVRAESIGNSIGADSDAAKHVFNVLQDYAKYGRVIDGPVDDATRAFFAKTPQGRAALSVHDAIASGDLSRGAGSLYKVDLPDDQIAKMLDWDKPLSQQAPDVRNAIKKATDDAMKSASLSGMAIFESLPPDMTGGQWHHAMARLIGTSHQQTPIADALRQQGIPGIRYLDGGSRGAGTGTSNFVVFPGNEGILNILERQ